MENEDFSDGFHTEHMPYAAIGTPRWRSSISGRFEGGHGAGHGPASRAAARS
jgi:hypothetical protein